MNEETQQNTDEVVQVEAAMQTDNPRRIFKTGSTIISEAPEMRELSAESIRNLLKHTYPEVANATIRETPQTDGTLLVEFLPVPGRKG
jgi:hypothetical protein